MRVFLTGGTGYLGGQVARVLLESGHEVLALVRHREAGAGLLGAGASLVEGDPREQGEWSAALESAEGLVVTGGLIRARRVEAEAFDRVNVAAVLALVDRAQAAEIPRVVVSGSFHALGPSAPGKVKDESALEEEPAPLLSVNDHVRTKAQVARRLRERQRRGHRVVQVFPTVLVGPGKRTAGNHTARVFALIGRRRFPGLIGSGKQLWNVVGVEDAARGHVHALERGRPGENYILGGENWTQSRLARRVADHFGMKPSLRGLGRAAPLAFALGCEGWASLTRRPPLITRDEVRLFDADWAYTSAKAKEELGYRPSEVDGVVAEVVRWLREEVWKRR